jgi:tRNA pseudouridine38-40 synthase
MRYKITVEYDGTNLVGWQRQKDGPSAQAFLEDAVFGFSHQRTDVFGAGRTDAGVNAMTMYAHFDSKLPIVNLGLLQRSLNGILPPDIAIHDIIAVHDEAHARFDATSRTYRYFAHTAKSAVLQGLSWQCNPRLDFDMMNEAAQHLLDYEDFTSFSKLHTAVKTNTCNLTNARWESHRGIDNHVKQWVFTITADRFLRNMVRAIVGTLVDVGMRKISVEEFCGIIEKKDRCAAGTSMPAHALYLWDVEYPYL